jgi:outer membrane protein assembly factor BamB
MSSLRRWAPIAALVLAGGCAQQRDIRTQLLIQPDTARALGYQIAWPADLGLRGRQRILYAELLGDKLVTLESGNVVSVMDAGTGRMLWRTTVGTPLDRFSAPRRSGDQLVLCSETRCHIYDLQVGGLIRVLDLPYVSNTTPLIQSGLMIHGSSSGIVFAQDLERGLIRWTFQIGGSAGADPVLCGNLVVIASSTGWVFAFDPVSGVPAWRDQTWGPIAAPMGASNEMVYVASEDRSVYAFARATGRPSRQGREVWRYYTESRLKARPRVIGDSVYQLVPDEGLVALDALTGKPLWTLPWKDARPFMLKGGKLYVLRPGRILTVTPQDGLVLDEVVIPAVDDVLPQSTSGGDLYLIRVSGRILKLTSLR